MALAANGVNSSRMKTPMLIAATTLAAASAQASDTMRCGQWVVDDETPLQELLAKCGEPTRKEVKTEDIHRAPALTVVGACATCRVPERGHGG